ncbi:MAG: hypothetical protein ABI629_01090 [bacterium]
MRIRQWALLPMLVASMASAESATWKALGPEGGDLTEIAVDPDDAQITYVVGRFELYRRAGAHSTWQLVQGVSPNTIATAPGGRVYAGGNGSFYRSADSGATFQPLFSNVSGESVLAFAVEAEDSEQLYQVTRPFESRATTNIWHSDDGGDSWTLLSTVDAASAVLGLHIDADRPDRLYLALASAGVLISEDSGATWSSSGATLPCPRGDGSSCLASFVALRDAEHTLLAGTYSEGVFRSTDAGSHWQRSDDGLGTTFASAFAEVGETGTVYAGIGTPGLNGSSAPPYGTARSDDSGATWTVLAQSATPARIAALSAEPDAILAATGGLEDGAGLYASRDGGATWTTDQAGLDAICFLYFGAAATPMTTLYASATRDVSGLYSTADGGKTWRASDDTASRSPTDLQIDPNDPQHIYLSDRTALFVTEDGGASWARHATGAATSISALSIDPRDAQTLYAATYASGVSKSTDGGVSWTLVYRETRPDPYRDMAIDDATGTVFALFSDRVLRSRDGGATWQSVLSTSGGDDTLQDIAVAPTSPSTLLVAGFQGLRVSHDGGVQWALAGLPDAQGNVFALAVDPSRARTVYALVGATPYRSDDGGDSWQPAGEALPITSFNLTVDPHDRRILYAATCGAGVQTLMQKSSPSGSADTDGCAIGPADNRNAWPLAPACLLALLVIARRLRTPD